jgi:hypothetical protein
MPLATTLPRALGAALIWVAAAATAATWRVGPDGDLPRLADALRRAGDGDVILVAPGDYHGDVGVIRQLQLTIRGVGARPVFHADGRDAEGKAQLVVKAGEITIENLAFTGTRVRDLNGAGIRFERGHLTVRRCAFFDNQNGILTSNFGDARLTIEDSEFGDAPGTPGHLDHLLYVGRIAEATITGSRFSRGHTGHLIKSRARRTTIEANLIVDGPLGQASYEIDLPNGGEARIVGNLIEQSARAQNLTLVSYGAEGTAWPRSTLVMAHNTLVNDAAAEAAFVRVWAERLPPTATVDLINNLGVGAGRWESTLPGQVQGNIVVPKTALVDPDGLDFALVPDSPWRARAAAPRLADGTDVAPRAVFTLPAGTRPLAPPAAWSPGAIQR